MKTLLKYKLIKFVYKFLCKLVPIKNNRILFIDNNDLKNTKNIYEEIEKLKGKQYECKFLVKNKINQNYPTIDIKNPLSLYYLATSKYWIVHSHLESFLRLGIIPRETTQYIQVWHATGAIKKFGQDSIGETLDDKELLKIESKHITKIVVSSKLWKKPFASAFGVSEEKIAILGTPRTDFLFNEQQKNKVRINLYNKYPELKGKKIIMYAPTFRDNDLNENIRLDLNLMKKKLGKEYIIILKFHPHAKCFLEKEEDVYDFSKYYDINELFLITDILITDYSSVALEFSILEKEIIFFAYDLKKYGNKLRGFYYDYKDFIIKNSLAETTEDVIEIIKSKRIKKEDIIKFKNKNYDYLDGKSSNRFIQSFL